MEIIQKKKKNHGAKTLVHLESDLKMLNLWVEMRYRLNNGLISL